MILIACLNSLARAHLVQKSNSIDQYCCSLWYENLGHIKYFQLISQCCNALWTTGDKERRSYLWHILIKSKSGPILISLIKSVLIGWKCNLIDSFYIEMITPVSNYIVCFYLWTCKFLKHSFPPPQYYYMGVIFLFRSMALDSNGKQQSSRKICVLFVQMISWAIFEFSTFRAWAFVFLQPSPLSQPCSLSP